MTMRAEGSVVCPQCGGSIQIEIWQSINVTLDPSLKSKLLMGELFAYECPCCGMKTSIVYDFLYHDMDQFLMVFLWTPKGDESSPADPFPFESTFTNRYTLRMVPTLNDLVEKVLIFDAGLDDLSVEVMKYHLGNMEGVSREDPIYFAGSFTAEEDGEDALAFQILRSQGSYQIGFRRKELEENARKVLDLLGGSPVLSGDTWHQINARYVERLLEQLR